MAEQFKPYLYQKNELSVESDCLIWGNRVIIPFHLRNKNITELHDNHPGIVRMKAFGQNVLIIYDSFSKWINAFPMKNIKATSVISCLRNVFSTHGIPYFLVTMGPHFQVRNLMNFVK